MYLPFRYSKNIEKQILWYFLALLFCFKRYEYVLDVGCGYAQNIRFIRFNFYMGIDIDNKRILKNKEKFNGKKFNFFQHDIIKNKFLYKKDFDLILLIQVMTNSLFSKKEVTKGLQNLIKIMKGTLIFNTSSKNKKDIMEIENMLRISNIKYKKIYYGLPSFIRKIKIPIISQLISFICLILIIANNRFFNKEKIIYICKIN
tara:strand:- start:6168 stop:6773 length:606 start_codon:yes stop_codon:yes gene_type:complete